jgi:hypothetical protein
MPFGIVWTRFFNSHNKRVQLEMRWPIRLRVLPQNSRWWNRDGWAGWLLTMGPYIGHWETGDLRWMPTRRFPVNQFIRFHRIKRKLAMEDAGYDTDVVIETLDELSANEPLVQLPEDVGEAAVDKEDVA